MAITPTLKEFQDRVVVLTGERDKLQIHAITYDGAIQECEYWIRVLEAEESTPPSDEKTSDETPTPEDGTDKTEDDVRPLPG